MSQNVFNLFRALNTIHDALPKDTILTHVQSKFATGSENDDFSHIYRRKTRLQLCLISACVCGIEFCYAAETAFVTPILLQIGVPVLYMTMVWCISPLLGILVVPLLGSLSDKCPYKMGRRRPFILLLSCGIVIGLILVPEGKSIGKLLGDVYAVHIQPATDLAMTAGYSMNLTTPSLLYDSNGNSNGVPVNGYSDDSLVPPATQVMPVEGVTEEAAADGYLNKPHVWSIIFTVIGVVMLDFSCDACQSPCRAYMLDVTTVEDHSLGLSTFTVLAGLGGSLGYIFGGINWGDTKVGASFGSHVRVVFTIVLVLYIICLLLTMTSIKEVPLDKLGISKEDIQGKKKKKEGRKYRKFTNEEDSDDEREKIMNNGHPKKYGLEETTLSIDKAEECDSNFDATLSKEPGMGHHDDCEKSPYQNDPGRKEADRQLEGSEATQPEMPILEAVTLKTYLMSIVHMPKSLFVLCLTNLFCWMSLLSYSLYFTNFVGQSVFGGIPSAPEGSPAQVAYEAGVRTGSYGMALYSLSCSIYSLTIERIIYKFGARRVYILSQLVYTVGSALMAITRHPVAVILLSPTAGIMYATLFTMPYILVAHYHSSNTFHGREEAPEGTPVTGKPLQGPADPEKAPQKPPQKGTPAGVRGLGTDVALLSSMVFVAQFILCSLMGTIIHFTGSTVAVVVSASILSACGALSATQVFYLDL